MWNTATATTIHIERIDVGPPKTTRIASAAAGSQYCKTSIVNSEGTSPRPTLLRVATPTPPRKSSNPVPAMNPDITGCGTKRTRYPKPNRPTSHSEAPQATTAMAKYTITVALGSLVPAATSAATVAVVAASTIVTLFLAPATITWNDERSATIADAMTDPATKRTTARSSASLTTPVNTSAAKAIAFAI